MRNNFLQKQKYHTSIKYTLLFCTLLFNSISIANDEKVNLFSMSVGGYSTDYSGDFLYTVEGRSGSIAFSSKADFGLGMEYSRVISPYFTLDSSLHLFLRRNTIKNTTCRDSSTRVLVSCKVSLNSNFIALSMFATYRYPIGLFSTIYLGSGLSINRFSQKTSYKATGYEEESIRSFSSSPKVNLGFKLGASYKKLYVEYMYFGETNKAQTSALGVSSLSVGFVF